VESKILGSGNLFLFISKKWLHELGLSKEAFGVAAQITSSVETSYSLPQVTGTVERNRESCTCNDALIQFATETAKEGFNLMGTSPLCNFC
ncbi:MAG: hypothetical protein U9N80_13955, partial [Chloroflexota bacterium]|nr:hypothetical protein [Chloroflexota bacterium]